MTMIVFFGVVMMAYDWPLTLLGVSIVALNLLVLRLVSERRVDGNRRLLLEQGKMHGALLGGLANMETLKATSRERDLFSSLAGHQAKVQSTSQELGETTQLMLLGPFLLTGLASAAVLAYGGLRVMDGDLTMGMLVAFQSLMASFTEPVNNLMDLGAKVQEAHGDINRLDDVLRYPPDPRLDGEEEQELPEGRGKLSGQLELRDIRFGYSPLAEPLLEGFWSVYLGPVLLARFDEQEGRVYS